MKLFLSIAAAACLTAAFSQEKLATPAIGIRAFAKSWNQTLMIQPALESEGILTDAAGCLVAEKQCPPSSVVSGMTRAAVAGNRLTIHIEGAGRADEIRVVVNGMEVETKENVDLPAYLAEVALQDVGTVHIFAKSGDEKAELHLQVEEASFSSNSSKVQQRAAAASISSSIFRFVTEVAEEGNWEVLTGSGTGGRLITTTNRCFEPAFPLWACPAQWVYFGYTDRARRGEIVRTRVDFAGTASRLGVLIDGRVRAQWTNVALPVIVPQNVSVNPADDNIYVFAVINGTYVERRLPVGTRPF